MSLGDCSLDSMDYWDKGKLCSFHSNWRMDLKESLACSVDEVIDRKREKYWIWDRGMFWPEVQPFFAAKIAENMSYATGVGGYFTYRYLENLQQHCQW